MKYMRPTRQRKPHATTGHFYSTPDVCSLFSFVGCLIICLLIGFMFAMFVKPACADTRITLEANGQFSHAKQLFTQKKYLLAMLEFERFIYLFPDDERLSEARFHVGMALYTQHQYEQAIQAFNHLIQMEGRPSVYQVRSYFMAVESMLRLGRQSAALTTLHHLEIQSDDSDVRDEANYRMGWIFLDSSNWGQARRAFDKISQKNQARYRLTDLINHLDETDDIDRKSPGLAGALAIIPGGGYLYCKRYRDALISFLINGALIYAAYEAFDNDLIALGSLITFVEIGFYSGNIYGSISSAHKYNRDRQSGFVDHLKKNVRIKLSSRPQNKGLELSLQYRF